ncbi:diguanylate cyclase [Bacillus salacetis]|uniref:Diguanylate cyclase n=1 Tax=Bacillus salacetis TaxID=2315464 RepID=A0A3A1QWA4_9BACI|nr:histidine kinase N-terminal 7TM domain-containing protein [Bacillus salacetis]RIW30402.1 diguanylate cyclase [Bacillus salacetis]
MPEEIVFYILLLALAGLLSISLSIFSYFKLREAPGGRQYVLATLLSAIFAFTYILELLSSSLDEARFWLGIEYLVMPFIPGYLLWMCMELAGIKLRQRHLYVLFIFPIVTVFMHHTNGLHHLYYSSVELRTGVPITIVDLEYGPFFYVHSLYLFLCLSISVVTLCFQLTKPQLRFRLQVILMIAGLFVPVAANYLYLNELSPYGIDLGPVSMSASFILHGISLFSYQMFNVLPIAREKVFDSMSEGVIVVDHNGAIVDYNLAMKLILPQLHPLMIGKPIQAAVSMNSGLDILLDSGVPCDFENVTGTETKNYQIRFSPVFRKGTILIGKIITFTDITERVALQNTLKKLASYDGLTQVYNRTYFHEKAESNLGTGINSIILFDIDHFKKVNDTYGHEMGDIVLTQIAKTAKNLLKPDDFIGRYGGEEFIVFLKDREEIDAYLLADVIRKEIADNLVTSDNHVIRVTSSFGVSSIENNSSSANERIKEAAGRADKALYTAKREGRNRVKTYRSSLGSLQTMQDSFHQ